MNDKRGCECICHLEGTHFEKPLVFSTHHPSMCRCHSAPSSERGWEFVECASCAAKAGSPILCYGCLRNRNTIEELKEHLPRIEDETRSSLLQELKERVEGMKKLRPEGAKHGSYKVRQIGIHNAALADALSLLTSLEAKPKKK